MESDGTGNAPFFFVLFTSMLISEYGLEMKNVIEKSNLKKYHNETKSHGSRGWLWRS